MPITKRNVLQHELIGLEAQVVSSSDPGLVGVRGTIVDETRNMLVVDRAGKTKAFAKALARLRLTLPTGEEVEIDGAKLVASPEDRTKRGGKG